MPWIFSAHQDADTGYDYLYGASKAQRTTTTSSDDFRRFIIGGVLRWNGFLAAGRTMQTQRKGFAPLSARTVTNDTRHIDAHGYDDCDDTAK